jgi:hypothetical protein
MSFERRAIEPPCDRNTTIDDFLETRVLLLHNCPNLSSQNRSGHTTGADAQMGESNP